MASDKHSSSYRKDREEHGRNETVFDDVVLVTNGRKVKTQSSLLAENSEVFADTLRPLYEDRAMVSPWDPPHEVDMKGRDYKDVKLVLSFLKHNGSREDLKGDNVWRVLPIADEYKMSQLTKNCGLALTESFISMRDEKESGRFTTAESLRYLAAADRYSFHKLKKLCLTEMAKSHSAEARKEILDDKHISWKLKAHILDSMFDAQNDDTEKRLKQLQHTMDLRCSEVERRRQEYSQSMEAWKEDLRKETDQMKKEIKDRHEEFINKSFRAKIERDITERLTKVDTKLTAYVEETLTELKAGLKELQRKEYDHMREFETLNGKILEKIEKADNTTKLKITSVLKTIKDGAHESLTLTRDVTADIQDKLDSTCDTITDFCRITKENLWTYLLSCHYKESINILTSTGHLQKEVERLNEEIAIKIRSISEVEIMNEAAKLEQQRTKAELFLYKKKWTAVNTWLKWAAPVDDENEIKCKCRRHVAPRR